jgi:hypothetical protein
MKKYILFLFLGLCSNILFAQDTILLTTGKKIVDIEVMEITDDYVLYQKWKKDKIKERIIERSEVYSIHNKDGSNMVLYKKDSLEGFMPNADQMESYVKGEVQSRRFYKNKSVTYGGVVVGVGTSLLGFKVGHFYTIVAPAAYSAIVAAWEPNLDRFEDITATQQKNNYFMEGYRDYARMKKVKNAALSSHISFLATLGVMTLF